MKKQLLHNGWVFQQANSATTDWLSATVPGTVHQDLLANGRIQDPYYGMNEAQQQWIGETDWDYRLVFDVEDLSAPQIDLCFEGLDTLATVFLNGQEILQSNNMFVPHRIPVKHLLQATQNELRIVFASAFKYGKAQEAQYGVRTAWNGDMSRVYVRKAQYHYGWDWGPTFITAGVWRDAYLHHYVARLTDVQTVVEVAEDLQTATIHYTASTSNAQAIRVKVLDPAQQVVFEGETPANTPLSIAVSQPQLWYPFTHGAQPLYTVVSELVSNGETLDRDEKRVGLRRLRLVQDPIPNEVGTSFYFEINNEGVFSGGANWIPADTFLPRITPADYRAWLDLAVRGNMNMLRVWGGGIYESDLFYDLCDEMGVLVWQDFLFACGLYPAHPEFLDTVRAEAEANVKRLRHHASLVIWCGNNEDYAIAESVGAYDADYNGDFSTLRFSAREIYERLLPSVCAELDNTRPYWQGSPYGGKFSSEQTIGDRHTWDVWHGGMNPYQNYTAFTGRFVSEFGMQAYPNRALINAYIPADEQHIYSQTMEYHNKATQGVSRLAFYVSANFPPTTDLDRTIYLTQLVQAEALTYAYMGWRRLWGTPEARKVGGSLVWQINDSYPVVSWALVDYHRTPKMGYYATKRAMQPMVVGLAHGKAGVDAWVLSDKALQAEVEISGWTVSGEEVACKKIAVTLEANTVQELGTFDIEAPIHRIRLLIEGMVMARHVLWQQPLKYLPLHSANVSVERLSPNKIALHSAVPVKAVWVEATSTTEWDDNGVDLLPDETIMLTATQDLPEVLLLESLNQ